MRKRDNPYTPGAGRRPAVLAGRDDDLVGFEDVLGRLAGGGYERSIIYTGLRGVGKTVLLMELDVLATDAGWATTDVQEVGSTPDFRATFTGMAVRLLRQMSRRHRYRERVDAALGVVKAFSLAVPGSPVQIKLAVEPRTGRADSGDPEQDLAELLIEIGEAARAGGTGALFLIDEMQQLDAVSLSALCIAFQAVSRNGLPVALVGAGLPDLQAKLLASRPYADRLFDYRTLGRLAVPEAAHALRAPAARLGVDYTEEAVALALDSTAGFPYFLQVLGQEIWNVAEGSPFGVADVRAAHPPYRDTLGRNFFRPRFEIATDAEQRYLMAMGDLGAGPYRSRDVAARYGAPDQRGVSVHRDSLIRKGLIWSPRRGEVDFTVPLFADYLRESHPLDRDPG